MNIIKNRVPLQSRSIQSDTLFLPFSLHVNYLVQRINWVQYFRGLPWSERKQLLSLSLAILHIPLLYWDIRGVVCMPARFSEVQLLSYFLGSLLRSVWSSWNTITIREIASVQANGPTKLVANFAISFRNHRMKTIYYNWYTSFLS